MTFYLTILRKKNGKIHTELRDINECKLKELRDINECKL